jgi:hypothetical protein
MKRTLIFSLLACIFIFAQCKKDKQSSTSDNPYGLPNATKEGKNTLGFLLNGVAWRPKGFNGTANLSIDLDFNFNEGIFNIASYRTINTDTEQFTIGVSDSLNLINLPHTFSIQPNSPFGVSYTKGFCDYFSKDASTTATGTLTLTKLDRSNRIISGIFNASLSKSGCQLVNITEGRFDMAY